MKNVAILAWALASAGLMAIGAFGPWVKALGISVGGTDGANDGWIVVAVALIGALLAVIARERKWAGLLVILAGIAGTATTVYDRVHVSNVISSTGAQGIASVGWGLNLAMVASISLAVSGITSFARSRDEDQAVVTVTEAQPQAPATVPAGWYQDPNDPSFLRYWTGTAWTTHTATPSG